jgi:hypothetical protein
MMTVGRAGTRNFRRLVRGGFKNSNEFRAISGCHTTLFISNPVAGLNCAEHNEAKDLRETLKQASEPEREEDEENWTIWK